MAKDRISVDVHGKTVELTSLDKVLYPDDYITKAEVVNYYVTVAPALLYHIKERPLSLVRYPEGIDGESFFQKNRPKGAPSWVKSVQLGESTPINYVQANDEASLAWLANSAALELHIMNVRGPNYDTPDHLSFDIDPPADLPFQQVAALAFQLKEHLEGFGYQPFAKTSGKKGIHLFVPVESRFSIDECYEAAKEMAKSFVDKNSEITTVSMKKDYRKKTGKVLIDVVRNASGQTTIAPYSLRAVKGASVSTPLTWDELKGLDSPSFFNIDTIPERLQKDGDPWESFYAHATLLHSKGQRGAVSVPVSLDAYKRKRAFDRTPEPAPRASSLSGSRFVIQRHHASRIHYDLRLEEGGVLKSWAVPKGLPPYPGIKRLAVATEDHPLEYLHFEGVIPKGQYGGGTMWVFASGQYEVVDRTKHSTSIRLHADGLGGTYRLYKTGGKDWMIERLDEPAFNLLQASLDPMAPESSDAIPEWPEDDYWCEVKWDGIRALIAIDEGAVRITTRHQLDITANFPELHVPEAFSSVSAVFDGEIICLGKEGKPDFELVVGRMHRKGKRNIDAGVKAYPAYCMLFDCLYLDGRSVMAEPLRRRREWLEDALRKRGRYDISETYPDCLGLWDTIEEYGMEGIIAKRKESPYRLGRTTDWLKLKRWHTEDFVIAGYTPGNGNRKGTIGALHLAEYTPGGFVYRGKVGTGFNQRSLQQLYKELKDAPEPLVEVKGRPRERAAVWVAPTLVCEISYGERTSAGLLRKASFQRLRKDIDILDYIENKTELPV